jgi:hypothetical protein
VKQGLGRLPEKAKFNKGNNMDVAEITRLLTLGQAPRY